MIQMAMELKVVVPGIFPPMRVGPEMVYWSGSIPHLREYGNTKGEELLDKALNLKRMHLDDSPIVLPRNIRVVSGIDGTYMMPLTDDILLPKSDKFIVDENYGPGLISVTKKFKRRPVEDQPLDKDLFLKEYQKHTKKGLYPCHRYPKELVRSSQMFANPELMDEETLRKFTGLRVYQFWLLVDDFILTGLRPGKFKLSYAAQVLLHLMKIRKGFDNDILACLFDVGKETVRKTWWRTLFHHFHMNKDTPKMWNRPNLTDQDIDNIFEEINEYQDEQYKKLSSFFVDPRTIDANGQSTGAAPRTPVVLLIDRYVKLLVQNFNTR